MPFVSRAQQAWGHTKEGMEALGGPEKVAEWDSATKSKQLPERKPQQPRKPVDYGALVMHARKFS